ncbi:hypothetical protein PGN_1822 [Porphyromonas gingivalis ATCC 33277]|uniref:Uncharacterized protein n=1 Tax=Porphyromonas gingivalis (strain ATCC 33277 / DSM 20709 / CIP 103683 / JCM 12257 / NCTC 11834 / 2561) TaxID=431947 RepID=B2RLU6_PORG3|nr:hypothetical protein PGN_1822 [Porphyromonas gingivalis ATCC 33277]
MLLFNLIHFASCVKDFVKTHFSLLALNLIKDKK